MLLQHTCPVHCLTQHPWSFTLSSIRQFLSAFVDSVVLLAMLVSAEGVVIYVGGQYVQAREPDLNAEITGFERIPESPLAIISYRDLQRCDNKRSCVQMIDLNCGVEVPMGFPESAAADRLRRTSEFRYRRQTTTEQHPQIFRRVCDHYKHPLDRQRLRFLSCEESDSVIAYGTSLSRWESDGNAPAWERSFSENPVVTVTQRGRDLLIALLFGQILRVDSATGQVTGPVVNLENRVLSISVSPDGELAAFLLQFGRFAVVSLQERRVLYARDRAGFGFVPEFSPSSQKLCVGCAENSDNLVILSSKSGQLEGEIRQVRSSEFRGVRWGSDDLTLYSWDRTGTIDAWKVQSGAGCLQWSYRPVRHSILSDLGL